MIIIVATNWDSTMSHVLGSYVESSQQPYKQVLLSSFYRSGKQELLKYTWWSKDSDLCWDYERKNSIEGPFGKSNDLPNIARVSGTSTQGAVIRAKFLKLTQVYMLLSVEHPEGVIMTSVFYEEFLHEGKTLMFWGNPDLLTFHLRLQHIMVSF